MGSDYTNSKGDRFVAGRDQRVGDEVFDPTREDHRRAFENWTGPKDSGESTDWSWEDEPPGEDDDVEVTATSPDSVIVTAEGGTEVTVVTANTHQNVRSGRKSSVTPGSMDIRRS